VAGGKRLILPAWLLASTVAGATCLPAESGLALPKGRATIDSLRKATRRRELPDSVRYLTLRALSDALFAQDEVAARRDGEQAVQLARHRRDWPGVAAALYQLVVNCERAADYVAAMQYSQEGAGVARARQLPGGWRFTQCMDLVPVDTKGMSSNLQYMRQASRQQPRSTTRSKSRRAGRRASPRPRERGRPSRSRSPLSPAPL
jgi:hypothetical protein